MKSLPIAWLALIAPLLLTGCAPSPSLEEQTKLIEYEKCLEMSTDELNRVIEEVMNLGSRSDAQVRLEYSLLKDFKKSFDSTLGKCKDLRP